jgi:hypothetical protein
MRLAFAGCGFALRSATLVLPPGASPWGAQVDLMIVGHRPDDRQGDWLT